MRLFPTPRQMLVGAVGTFAVVSIASAQLSVTTKDSARNASPWANTDVNAKIPVLLSFSGGISLGSYQAGVNWGLTEFFKLTRRSATYRADHLLPSLEIKAMTGASAGNINAVLTGIQYCDTVPAQTPDSSLFWKVWVYTGWEELFPPSWQRQSCDRGVFDRTHLKTFTEKEVARVMLQSRYQNGCNIPVGIVVTRLDPGRVALDNQIQVETQRYVVLFALQESNGTLRFKETSKQLLSERSLGAQIALRGNDVGFLSSDQVFSVVEASSSYPVAFAPRAIRFHEPTCILGAPEGLGCWQEDEREFMDGGVFDNNPMSLALSMHGSLASLDSSEAKSETIPRLIFVDPGRLRGELARRASLRSRSGDQMDGLSAVANLVGGFVPAARKYELQSLARSIWERDSKYSDGYRKKAWVSSTDRAHPVVGEYVSAFGAFFGRPFREFDFYVGVADAAHFIARDILCDPTRMAARGREVTPAGRSSCTWKETYNLVQSQFVLGPVGLSTVRSILQRESPSEPTLAGAPTVVLSSAEKRRRILGAVEEATARDVSARQDPDCVDGDFGAKLLCYDGFGQFLAAFASRDSVRSWISAMSQNSACLPHVVYPERSECLAEPTLAALLHDQHATMHRLLDKSIRRIRDVEETRSDRGMKNYKFLVKSAEFLYRSIDRRARRGLDLDPSSIPPHERGMWRAFHYMPHYVGAAVGIDGFQTGWQPTYHFSRHIVAVMPFEIMHLPKSYEVWAPYAWYSDFTPSLGVKLPYALVTQIQAGPRFRSYAGQPSKYNTAYPETEITVYVLSGKARLSTYVLRNRSRSRRDYPLVATLSFADANGLLYWILR